MMRVVSLAPAALLLILPAPGRAQQPTAPGGFDYYLLSLSWSPEYCAAARGHADPEQCRADHPYGFVLHGLWPQFEGGRYPATCAGADAVPEPLVRKMLPIMPAAALIRHAWQKHGTCTGLSQEAYFDAATRAFRSVVVPEPYQAPGSEVSLGLPELKAAFQAVNPALAAGDIAVICGQNHLIELRVCLTKEMQPRPCGQAVHDQCRDQPVILRGVGRP